MSSIGRLVADRMMVIQLLYTCLRRYCFPCIKGNIRYTIFTHLDLIAIFKKIKKQFSNKLPPLEQPFLRVHS